MFDHYPGEIIGLNQIFQHVSNFPSCPKTSGVENIASSRKSSIIAIRIWVESHDFRRWSPCVCPCCSVLHDHYTKNLLKPLVNGNEQQREVPQNTISFTCFV